MKHIMGPQSRSELSGVKEGDVQPNAVDLRVDKVFRIESNLFTIDESQKVHRGSTEMIPNENGNWFLPAGHYEVIMENNIKVGDNEAGWVITRSTLNRNGVFLTSGLYDSGYDGCMAGCMHIAVGDMKLQRGTRIGQYLSFEAEALHSYDGDYGHAKGHDEKYK
jgi:deoxycytidine triphosphate deaminase